MAQTYFLYVSDRRYSVPNLNIVECADDERAAAVAWEKLRASPFHTAVAIHDKSNAPLQVLSAR